MIVIINGEVQAEGSGPELIEEWGVITDALVLNIAKETGKTKEYVASNMVSLYMESLNKDEEE